MPGENQSIPIAGSTVKIKGLTDQANKTFINGREISVQPDGSFYDEIIIPLGETEISLEVKDPKDNVKTYSKKIKAKENHFFLAGLADGTLNFSDSKSNFPVKRDSRTYDDRFQLDGKISYYLAGKVKGKYLIKSSLDTTKATQDKLFTNIDPDKYYPIYGDNSTVVYDVNSQGKFYVLLEKDKSGATFGNYQTQIGEEDSKLITYNRTLYGGKIHLETPQKTIYGDPRSKATLFLAEANQHAGHSELLATGGSLYYLRHRNIVEGSEQVRIEIRDKKSGMTIQSISQAENIDYEIKYDEGRILFKKPVLSVAASDTLITSSILEGNPVYIVVNYEYKNQEAFPLAPETLNERTGGFRLSQHLGDHLRGGITFLMEQKAGDNPNHNLLGGDATVKIGNFTKLNAEVARSRANSTGSYLSYNGGYDYTELLTNNAKGTDGSAVNVELNSTLGEYFGKDKEFLDLSAYWQYLDKNYAPVDSLFQAGSNKLGLNLTHKLTENDRLRFLYDRSDIQKNAKNQGVLNQLQANRVQDTTAQWVHTKDKFTFTSEYVFRNQKESFSPILDTPKDLKRDHLIGERIQYDVSKDTSLFLGQQLGITDLNDSFTSAGFSRKLNKDISLRAQAGAGPAGNSVLAGLDRTTDASSSTYSNYTLANSHTDGKTSITSFGSNTKISENASLRRERQFITSDIRGAYNTNLMALDNQLTPHLRFNTSYERRDEKATPRTLTGSEPQDAASLTVSYILPDRIKAYSKGEYRMNSDHVWQVLADTQGEFKVTQDIFLFGEHEYSKAKQTLSLIDKKQGGLAYRPVRFDWFNALFKYTRLKDFRPQNLGSADGGFLTTRSTADVLAGEFALDLPYHFQAVQKLAFKDEDIVASNPTNTVKTPEDRQAFLWIHRLNYHLTNRIDIAGEYRRLRQRGSAVQNKEKGVLVELTYQIVKHVAIGAGFNFTDFTDDLTIKTDKSARGFFLRLQGKY